MAHRGKRGVLVAFVWIVTAALMTLSQAKRRSGSDALSASCEGEAACASYVHFSKLATHKHFEPPDPGGFSASTHHLSGIFKIAGQQPVRKLRATVYYLDAQSRIFARESHALFGESPTDQSQSLPPGTAREFRVPITAAVPQDWLPVFRIAATQIEFGGPQKRERAGEESEPERELPGGNDRLVVPKL